MSSSKSVVSTNYASMFIDFENIYYSFLKIFGAPDETLRAAAGLIAQIKATALNDFSERIILQNAYADFDSLEQLVLGDLYLLGVQTKNVLGTEHKNAADMALCIDAMETLYTRSEISSFYIAAGDRDYIPLVQHLQRQAKTVRIVGIRKSLSGDLLTVAGEDFFLDAIEMIKPLIEQLSFRNQTSYYTTAGKVPIPGSPSAGRSDRLTDLAPSPSTSHSSQSPDAYLEEYEQDALRIMLRSFKGKPEIWMTPYLHKLRTEMPELAEYDRKEIVTRLSASGAIRVEKREGNPYPFSVIVVDWNHPLVRKANP